MIYEHYKVKRKFKRNAKVRDNPALTVTRVMPENGEPRFILQIVHGFCERRERYYPLMEYIAQSGGMAIIHDQRGHGQGALDDGTLGNLSGSERVSMSSVPSMQWSRYCGDIDMVFASANLNVPRETDTLPCFEIGEFDKDNEEWEVSFPTAPRYLLGFSMGSMIVGIYNAVNSGIRPAGVILSGLPHHEKHVGAALFGTGILEALFGEEHYSRMLNRTAMTRYNRTFEPEENSDGKYLWLSNSIPNRLAFEYDPVCSHGCPIGAYRILMKLVRDVYSPSLYEVTYPSTPILCAAGEFDPIAGGEEGILYAVKFLGDMGYTDVRPLIYTGMRHEIYRDTDREAAFADIVRFIDDTIASASPKPGEENYYENRFSE